MIAIIVQSIFFIAGLCITLLAIIFPIDKADQIWDQCGMELKIAIFFSGLIVAGLPGIYMSVMKSFL